MSRSLIWLTSLAACQDLPPFVSPDDVAASPNPPLVEAPWRVERVQQSVPEQVDVLWVIDNSGSMADEQAALIGAFPSFIRYFADSGLDWHIGVVTTDADAPGEGGKLQGAAGLRYLEPDAPDPIQTFAAMARVGTDGSSDEQGRRVAWLALTTPLVDGYNHGFYREDASLHVIVISDEPDATVEPRLNEFVAWMGALKADPDDATLSAIVGPRGGCAGPGGRFAEDGGTYLDAARATGGLTASICAEDWIPLLDELGLHATRLRTEVFLGQIPVPDTIEVTVTADDYLYDGAIDPEGATAEGCDPIQPSSPAAEACADGASCFHWRYDCTRNSVQITDWVPPRGSVIEVRYQLRDR